MSCFAGGKESFIADIYWSLRHAVSKDKSICPRCGYVAFQHGFIPNERYYCTECHLWEPIDVRERNNMKKEIRDELLVGLLLVLLILYELFLFSLC